MNMSWDPLPCRVSGSWWRQDGNDWMRLGLDQANLDRRLVAHRSKVTGSAGQDSVRVHVRKTLQTWSFSACFSKTNNMTETAAVICYIILNKLITFSELNLQKNMYQQICSQVEQSVGCDWSWISWLCTFYSTGGIYLEEASASRQVYLPQRAW